MVVLICLMLTCLCSLHQLTHLCDIPFCATEIHEKYVYEIAAMDNGHSFLLQGVLGSHRNDLTEFRVLEKTNRFLLVFGFDCGAFEVIGPFLQNVSEWIL